MKLCFFVRPSAGCRIANANRNEYSLLADFVAKVPKGAARAHGDYLQSLTEVGSIVCHGPVDDPKGGWGLSIFSAKDQTEVERLTADPIILDDVGARYEILLMKQLWMKGAN